MVRTNKRQIPRKTRARRRASEKSATAGKPTTSLVLEPHQVIVRPLVTEKGMHRSTRHNQYAFEISTLANKADVRRAVEELFNVKVNHVATQNRKGKPRRTRFRSGYTKDWKKAIVTLDEEHRINFF
jgi:large subunit ribosomal protein L23